MRELPSPWRRYLDRVLPRPPAEPRGTLLTQRGEILLEGGKWVPFTAEQWFDAKVCAFCWHARARMAPLVTAVVEDAYEDGHGRLEAKVFGFVRVAHGEPGASLDRGELVRYLGELAWNPLALLHNPELRFGEAPDGKARVWAHDPSSYVDATFDAEGRIATIETTTRERGTSGPVPWSGRFLAWGERGGVEIPLEAEVSWDPPEGRQVYWRATIEDFAWR